MSGNGQAPSRLVLVNDTNPTYNWFGHLDYSWFENSGSLKSTPYFESGPDQLAQLVEKSSARQQIRVTLGTSDCTTVSGTRNCTEACSDPTTLFVPANLRACTMLAGAALLVQNETYSIDDSDTSTSDVMNAWRVPDLSSYNATALLAHVAECISESCTVVSRLGECPNNLQKLADADIRVDDLGAVASQLGHYCDGMNVETSPDIAGPGVLLSYLFQTLLALLLYFMLRGSTTWASHLDAVFRHHARPISSNPSQTKSNTTLLSRLASSRVGAVATSALVEFQEMQIYFIASVQIATLVSYNPSTTKTTSANNDSYAAMLLNSGLAGLLATSSMACIILVQCCLQRVHMYWWYTFILMTYAVVFTLVIFARRSNLMPPADGLWESFKDDTLLPMCGNNPSPMTYCRPPRDTRFLDNAVAGYLVCCLGAIAWLGLCVDQFVSNPPKGLAVAAGWIRSITQRGSTSGKRWPWKSLFTSYWIAIEFLLLCMVGYHLSQLILVLLDVDLSNASKWGFGQLIAVSVWAPTVAKFIYSNVFGVKAVFEPRLARSFSVTQERD